MTDISHGAALIIGAARQYLGMHERSGNNDGLPYDTFFDEDGDGRGDGGERAWCAAFVRRCCKDAGIILPGKWYLLPAVSYMIEELIKAGKYRNNTYTAKPGDIIFLDFQLDKSKERRMHVGIIEATPPKWYLTIEGNTSNAVARRRYMVGSVEVSGFGVVA